MDAPTGAAGDSVIAARRIDELDSVVQLGIASGRVVGVSFPASVSDDATTTHPLLDRIESYCGGAETTFTDVSVALLVDGDERAVLESVRSVPYGRTIDTQTLARTAAGVESDDAETVHAALRRNPAPVFVPDHRVRATQGTTPTGIAATLRSVEGIQL